MRHDTKIITPPTQEPIDLAMAKLWVRADADDQDSVIRELIRTAREECENLTGRATLTTTYQDSLDRFPITAVQLPPTNLSPLMPVVTDRWPYEVAPFSICLMRSPLIAISSIQYYDPEGTLQTLSSSEYTYDTTMEPGRVAPVDAWPATQLTRPGAVRITYTAGYASKAVIPSPMLHAMRMLIAHWYEHREAVTTGASTKEIEHGVQALLDKVRVCWTW